MSEHFDLHCSLVVESLFISDYFDGDVGFSFVIETVKSLAKASFAQDTKDFVAVRNMIIDYEIVIPPLIIKPIIELLQGWCLNLLGIQSHKVNLFVI